MADRKALRELRDWANRPHKPLVIRGPRQVGKTTRVRLFAAERFERLVELNLERHPELARVFAGNDPRATVRRFELHRNHDIVPGSTLLFLDEIQSTPEVLASLRCFFEEMPDLHVIAAGSLLDFALDEPEFAVPVGRIEYCHLGPMTGAPG